MIDLNALSKDQLIAMLAAAQAQPRAPSKLTCKVSAKGAVSVYGMGKWPVTLYRTQWERLLAPDTIKQISAFIAANVTLLTVKPATD